MSRSSWLDAVSGHVARAHARVQYERFVRLCKDAVGVQERVLRRRIAAHADSAFGREHGFERIRSYADFVARVPIRTYEELQPYVERMVRGETSALLGRGERVLMFAMTSGSTDQPKYVPVTAEFLRSYRCGWNVFGVKALLDHPEGFLRPILQVVSPMDERRTELGVPCGSISGLLAGTAKRVVRRFYVVPRETGEIEDPEARYYTIMRFAVPCDVGWMVTASPATPIKLARAASAHAEKLIRDIHDGTLRPPGAGGDVAAGLGGRLHPQPDVARRLSSILDIHGELLPRHYWNLAFLANWTGGTLGLHLADFPKYYGDTPVRDIGLLATEGRVSIPLEDSTAAGVLDVGSSFFEFVDAEADGSDADCVHRCEDLTVGAEYRVVLTTAAGFFRYDLGDRVVVRGYRGRAPIVEFLHRGAHVSSVTGEKLTEWQVTTAFERVGQALQLKETSFVLAPVWGDPPYYRLHVDGVATNGTALVQGVDRELKQLNVEYASKRSSGRLGMIELNGLPSGYLEGMNLLRQSRQGSAREQFKHQYLYTRPGADGEFPLARRQAAVANTSEGVSNE